MRAGCCFCLLGFGCLVTPMQLGLSILLAFDYAYVPITEKRRAAWTCFQACSLYALLAALCVCYMQPPSIQPVLPVKPKASDSDSDDEERSLMSSTGR
jgi:hypothetical protein